MCTEEQFWFVSFRCKRTSSLADQPWIYKQVCINEHPLHWLYYINMEPNYKYVIVFYNSISEELFEKYENEFDR